MSRAAAQAPLRWRASEPLGPEPPAGTSLELDEHDWWHFRRLGAHDAALARRLQGDRELTALAFDLYGLLYKPSPTWRDRGREWLAGAVVAALERTGGLTALRRRTELNEWGTVTALGKLIEALAPALEEGRRQGHHRAAGSGSNGQRRTAEGAEGARSRGQRPDAAPGGGVREAVAARSASQRELHRAADEFVRARAQLEAFDRTHDLADLPDARGATAAKVRRRLGKRDLGCEPPARRRGVPAGLQQQRDQLVQAMRRAGGAFEERRRAAREEERRANDRLARDGDPRLDAACAQARASLEEAFGVLDEVLLMFRENDTWGRDVGAAHELPLEELLEMGRLLRSDASLRKIVELAGRWSVTLKRRLPRGKSPHGRTETLGVDLGGELQRLIPSELAQLRHPLLRRALLARVVERRAMTTQLQGPHLLGRGPVIAVIDGSGSMAGARVTLAKGLCLALALRCWEQRRPFHVLTFGARGELREVSFPATEDFLPRLKGNLQLYFGGGTDFDGPLERVCELVQARPWSSADAVFVTDGHCVVAPGTLERLRAARKRTDLQVLGVLLAEGIGLDGVADATFALDAEAVVRATNHLPVDGLLRRVAGRC